MADFPPGYSNLHPLGSDELGTTYQARQDGPERGVALRILDLVLPSRPARRQLHSSCLAAISLNGHRGILDLHDAGFTPGNRPFIATGLPAGSLAGHLARHGPVPAEQAASLAAALAETLAAAHGQGVLHLDVRPENVVHTAAAPLLAYFGVSRAVATAGQAELPPGCLVHAAREMFGWDTPGPPADVYGLASTLYAALAGQAPYAAEARVGRAALYQRVLRGGPPPVPHPGVPPGLLTLIAAMMDPDPASRPALAEVAAGLGRFGAPGAGWAIFGGTRTAPAAAEPAEQVAASLPLPRHAAVTPLMSAGEPFPEPTPASQPAPPASAWERPTPTSPTPTSPTPTSPTPTSPTQPGFWTRMPTAATSPDPGPGSGMRNRHAGLILLLSAGVAALLTGFVWGMGTSPNPRPGPPIPTVRATSTAILMSPSQQAQYQVTRVRVTPRPGGARIRWSAPARTAGVTAFIVVAELTGRAEQEHTVGARRHGTVFAGLRAGRRYCFVIGTVVETASGQVGTATAPLACARIR